MPRLQTGVPPGVCRSSGSLVRFPTSTTRLMFAAMPYSLLPGIFRLDVVGFVGAVSSLVRTRVRVSVLLLRDGAIVRWDGFCDGLGVRRSDFHHRRYGDRSS